MLKFKFIAICFTLSVLMTKSYDQPSIAWQRCNGTTYDDVITDAIITTDGGVLTAVDYSGYDGDAIGLSDLSMPATLMKFDSLFNIQWYSSFGGTTNASAFRSVF